MGSPRRFGDYVLFKRLGVDDLGESYRAGRVAGASIERVVLLRLFNGRTIDRPALWRSVAARGPVQKLLTSARLAEGIELGVVAGTPFAAYAYVSGPNLLALLQRARSKPFPIPTEHALFIAERTAQRLAAARETRIQGERLHHGFLVPSLVSLSVEGEVQVLGAELAPGLRAQRELRGEPQIAPYLAPDAHPEGKVHAADDVYSLAAILYELLTGEPPADDAEALLAAVGDAKLAADGEALPQPLADLLRNSLAPRESRVSSVDKWHGILARQIAVGGHSPTTFNFAFFMHTLLRDEIDGERQEIERESEQEVPAASEPSAPAPAAPALPVGTGRAAAASPRRARWLVPALSAAILAIAALLAVYYLLDWRAWLGPGTRGEPATAVSPAPPPDAAPAADPAPEAMAPELTVEEVEAQVRQLLAQRAPEMEAEVRGEFDAKLERLRRQLADARAAARRRQQERERAALAQEAAQAPAPGGESVAAPPASPAAKPPAPAGPPTAEPAATGDAPAATGPPSAPPTTPPTARPEGPEKEAPAEAGRAEATPPAPTASETLVIDPGSEVVPPRMLSQPQPQYPPAARKFGKEATVRLRLLVDENGRVVDSERVGPRAGFGFDEAAERAARKTSWSPATRDGEPVSAWVELSVEFRP